MSNHEDETITEENAPPKVVSQITTITNISTKFPYLKKGEYDIWAMKMQNFISSSDLLYWNIVLNENSAKSMTTDNDGNLKIRPPVTAEEHQQVQREEKARTVLLFALPDEHMGDFYHMIDTRDIWNAIKARFDGNAELDKGYDKMQKILTQMNTLKIKPEPEDVNMKFLRGLPPSWFGYLSSSSTLSNAAFVSTVGSSQGNLSYQESRDGGYTTILSVSLGSSSSKGSSKSKCSVVDDVIYSFFVNHEIDQHLVYEDLDQMNKEEFKEYDLKHQMAMLSIKVHRFEKKHGRKIKFNGRENASIDWDKQTEEGNIEPRSLENFGMVAGIKIASDADSEGEVVFADNAIPTGVSVSAGEVAVVVVSLQSETEFTLMGLSTEKLIDRAAQEKQDLMTKLDNEIANQAKWNNSGKNLYKLIDSSMSVRTKRGLGLDKYIGEGELGIDDSKFSIFYTNSDELEEQPIYNRFASVDHIKAVPPSLTGNYMPPSNIPNIDESQMVYGKKATDSSEIKTNDDSISHSHDSVLFDFNDRQEDFPSVYTSSIETDVKSSKTLCNKFGSFNKESHFRKHKSVASKSCYVCGSYLHLIKDCDLHEQRLAKRNAEGNGILGKRLTGKLVHPNRPKPVSAGQPHPVADGQPNPVSTGDGILGLRTLNIQPKSTNFHSFIHNNQQIIFPITHNSLYSLYMTGGLNGKTAVKPSVGWPWTKYGMSKTKGSKINGGSKSKSWSSAKGLLGRPKLEKAKDRGIVDSGCSRSMSGNKDKLEDFKDFDGGEVTFGGSTGKI
nr:hypothetical protein [Tanacetum cinerariifolium]